VFEIRGQKNPTGGKANKKVPAARKSCEVQEHSGGNLAAEYARIERMEKRERGKEAGRDVSREGRARPSFGTLSGKNRGYIEGGRGEMKLHHLTSADVQIDSLIDGRKGRKTMRTGGEKGRSEKKRSAGGTTEGRGEWP